MDKEATLVNYCTFQKQDLSGKQTNSLANEIQRMDVKSLND